MSSEFMEFEQVFYLVYEKIENKSRRKDNLSTNYLKLK